MLALPPTGATPAEPGFATLCAHHGEQRLAHGGGAAPPIYETSAFVLPDAAAFEQRDRPGRAHFTGTRCGNPTVALLERKLARLEHGTWARALASGMGALTAAIRSLAAAGDHIVAGAHVYARGYLDRCLARWGVRTTYIAGSATADFVAAFRPETRILYVDSPTGPAEVLDVAALAAAARAHGVRVLFDNTWATPYFQNPLDSGCDLVVHSASKYLGGHSDLVAGVVVGRDEALRPGVLREAELAGATLDPLAAWLVLRGLRTLALRMEQHQRSGLALARLLAQHPRVLRVYHPGLASHPQHALAARQLRGYSGVFRFDLKEQTRAALHRFLNRLRLFGIGVSWGGHESLVLGGPIHRPGAEPGWGIRLHAGLEATADLVADVRQALED